MYIQKKIINDKHWTSQWIPISYKKYNKKESYTFFCGKDYNLFALCRCYKIGNIVEIGDVWIAPEYRGKILKSGKKYSHTFLSKIIAKIKKIYKNITFINLVVASTNIPAIKLYEKLKFVKIKNIDRKDLNITNGFLMQLRLLK